MRISGYNRVDLAEGKIRVCGVAVVVAMRSWIALCLWGSSPGPLYRRPGLKDLHEFVLD